MTTMEFFGLWFDLLYVIVKSGDDDRTRGHTLRYAIRRYAKEWSKMLCFLAKSFFCRAMPRANQLIVRAEKRIETSEKITSA